MNKLSQFSREFWLANVMELFERAAYYGFFVVLTLYLTDIVGFTDKETGVVAGVFFAGIYFFPPFVGAVADRIGFRNGLIVAFSLLTVGYFFLGLTHAKGAVLFFLVLLLLGAAFIKPLITGTVAKTTTPETRARGFALFYWVVNLGAFGGKTFVPWIRQGIGLAYVNYFSAAMAFTALIVALFLFKAEKRPAAGAAKTESKSFKDVFDSLIRIFSSPRLMVLTLIVAGFWTIQSQMYATMPKYVIRLIGPSAKPEWLANVNPLVVVLSVVWVTKIMGRFRAVSSILVGMIMMPFSALCMSWGKGLEVFTGPSIQLWGDFSMHPLTAMLIIGIAIQGFAECFISPRFLEYFSLQAPKGQEGLYLGFSHLHSFFSALAGFIISGFLLDAYCPDPKTLSPTLSAAEKAAAYANAHYIWYYFVGIGLIAAVAMFIFRLVVDRIDHAREMKHQPTEQVIEEFEKESD